MANYYYTTSKRLNDVVCYKQQHLVLLTQFSFFEIKCFKTTKNFSVCFKEEFYETGRATPPVGSRRLGESWRTCSVSGIGNGECELILSRRQRGATCAFQFLMAAIDDG